jgi:hypothetical protein
MLHVIEGEHGVEHHEPGGIGAVGSLAQIAQHRLEPRRCAVAQVTDRAAGESRQVGNERRPEIGHQPAQRRDERLVALGDLPRPLHRRLVVAGAENQERVLAEERIAADMFAAFHALQQEGVVGVFGNLEKGRHRRQQVGNQLLADRHECPAPRQFLELVE